jgi:hypothetical protein
MIYVPSKFLLIFLTQLIRTLQNALFRADLWSSNITLFDCEVHYFLLDILHELYWGCFYAPMNQSHSE